MKYLILISILICGCNSSTTVPIALINRASEVCAQNLGIKYIIEPLTKIEYDKLCNGRCFGHATGLYVSMGKVVCGNNGSFDISVSIPKELLE